MKLKPTYNVETDFASFCRRLKPLDEVMLQCVRHKRGWYYERGWVFQVTATTFHVAVPSARGTAVYRFSRKPRCPVLKCDNVTPKPRLWGWIPNNTGRMHRLISRNAATK